jgi:membrane-bound lytic murein transglycosylase D
MRNTLLLALAALYLAACATTAVTTTPKASGASAARVATPAKAKQLDADEFRKELDAAYADILARNTVSPSAPHVDIEAAASIPIPQHRTIDSALRLFSVDMKDSIQTSLLRSARFKQIIDKALADQNLPKGLAYLPVIESAYMTGLTSRAGAHGIWQFMPDTAREYGLRVDWWVDERADPERSTRAAASYIKDLYRTFNDWPLALAAYNCGPGRVKRSLDESGASTFWELLDAAALPRETRGYVPTFYAALIIASDPATYGFQLNEPQTIDEKRVDVRGPVSLEYIAEVTGVDERVLRDLNPSLRRGVVPPGRGSVLVPSHAAETLAARADTLRQGDAYIKYCTFTMRHGDSLKKLARALGTSVDTIEDMNNLASASDVGAGDSVYLPVRARELGALLAHVNDEEFFYAVKNGDTLYSIAKKHGVSVAELRELNDLKKTAKLHKGQKLRVASPRTMTAGGGM